MINSVAQTKLPSDTFHHRRSTKVSSETYPLYSCVNQFFWFNRSLDICGCSRVSDKGICALSKNCHKLELLDLTSTGVGHKRLVDEPLILILPLRHHTWSSPRVLDRRIFFCHIKITFSGWSGCRFLLVVYSTEVWWCEEKLHVRTL